MNYILHVNEHFSNEDKLTIIDPSVIGNIGRYINHSCDPNLELIVVRVEHWTPPKVALFAKIDISPETELTFDYGYEGTGSESHVSDKRCLCQTSRCRGYLPLHKSIKTS